MNNYLNWLLEMVNFDRLVGLRKGGFPTSLSYNRLLYFLSCKEFKCIIERDQNRVKDGLSLRYKYFEDFGQPEDILGVNASVLEVLVGLAIRLDREYIGDPGDPHPEFIFWEMICNLKLDKFDDSRWAYGEAERIVDIWLLREYNFDGNGGIFPLSVATFDQRNSEIWNQAMSYVIEKY